VRLFGVEVTNPNTVDVYIQFFDAAATASVTLGTTPPRYPFHVPPGVDTTLRGMHNESFPTPLLFSAGLCYAATTAPSGSSAPDAAVPVTLFVRSGK